MACRWRLHLQAPSLLLHHLLLSPLYPSPLQPPSLTPLSSLSSLSNNISYLSSWLVNIVSTLVDWFWCFFFDGGFLKEVSSWGISCRWKFHRIGLRVRGGYLPWYVFFSLWLHILLMSFSCSELLLILWLLQFLQHRPTNGINHDMNAINVINSTSKVPPPELLRRRWEMKWTDSLHRSRIPLLERCVLQVFLPDLIAYTMLTQPTRCTLYF